MRIAIADHEMDAAYIRHARVETLKSVDVEPRESLVAPLGIAKYVFAYSAEGKAIGMGETAMLSDVYSSYADTPYAEVADLNVICPLNQMASMRTVFVEPEHRHNKLLFPALTFGTAKLFYEMGARFATATTSATEPYLNRLYEKCGGTKVGTFSINENVEQSSLFLFDLEKALAHRAMQRLMRYVTFDYNRAMESA